MIYLLVTQERSNITGKGTWKKEYVARCRYLNKTPTREMTEQFNGAQKVFG